MDSHSRLHPTADTKTDAFANTRTYSGTNNDNANADTDRWC